jgi:alpha-beta hydrolase superfamily lysophospholipase
VALVIYFVRAFDSRNKPDIGPEHRVEFEHEFDASQEAVTDWSAYMALENKLAEELSRNILASKRADSLVDRYAASSITNPGNYDGNWNRSHEITATSPRGVAVLLHGLTDSPYSMHSTAEVLVAAGYSVVVPRMPGHGFAVGALLQVRWEDWAAAVRIAVRHAAQQDGANQALLLVGYSNGGLLAVDYALRCEQYEGLACPDKLVLMSPSIAVSPLAAITGLHRAVSWLAFFEKFQWQSVLPEIDPFKFTSFPKRAAWETYKLQGGAHKLLGQPEVISRLPPILTFQSAVDNTVSARAIVSLLYNRLPKNGSDLVVYDINSSSTMLTLMKGKPVNPAAYFRSMVPLNFDVTVLHNHESSGRAIDTMTLVAGATEAVIEETDLKWPEGIFSLSHIALPFPADDVVYGDGSGLSQADRRVAFGALAPRGERTVMRLNADYFLRMRYNPFFDFQQAYMIDWLDKAQHAEE